MTAPARGPDQPFAGTPPSGHCPRCGWSYDLHPWDAEGVDVGRCPTEEESILLTRMLARNDRRLHDLVASFPRAAR